MTNDTIAHQNDETNEPLPTTEHFDVTHADEEHEEMDTKSSSSSSKMENESLEDEQLNQLYNDWFNLDADLRLFEPKHKDYVSELDKVESLKSKYRVEFDKYKKKLDQLKKSLDRLKKAHPSKNEPTPPPQRHSDQQNSKLTNHLSNERTSNSLPSKNSSSALNGLDKSLSFAERLNLISEQINHNSLYLATIADTVPRKDPYLRVILGGVDVSILNKSAKWTYKQEYEKFKFIVTSISLFSSLLIWALPTSYRALDAAFHFLLVWYYCTLTIRESILIVNGSKIHPWWRAHHFISTIATGIMLTWPESPSYQTFRWQFFLFSFYLSVVQVLQFYYQRGCLYRLRALGETNDMEITIDGFHRWMFRGLSFLVPFLFAVYFFQLYNACVLFQLARLATTQEWQVPVLSLIFACLFLGNTLTTANVLREKIREKRPPKLLKEKYQSIRAFLATNYHRHRRPFQPVAIRVTDESSKCNDSSQSHAKDD